MATGQFIVSRGGRDLFYRDDELKRLASAGQLSAGDLVYHPTLGRWLYAKEVEEVRPEMESALTLGRPAGSQAVVANNGEAVVGFVLAMLGHLPVIGFFCCLAGLYFSNRGLRRAPALDNRGYALAVAGTVMSIVFLLPATACAALFVSLVAQ